MDSRGGEDWKKRLKALGIARKKLKRRKKGTKEEDFLRKEEGGRRSDASVSRSGEPSASSPFKENFLGSPRSLQKVEDGRVGEDIACALFKENQLLILHRNVRYPDGEIDIVVLDGATTVFVEVKWRRNDALGTPAEAVTPRKRARVVRAARRWLVANPGRSSSVRFDVVAIREEPPEVSWIRGAFDAGKA